MRTDRAVLGYRNLALEPAASISTTPSNDPAFPPSALEEMGYRTQWRTTNTTNLCEVSVDLGAVYGVDLVAVGGHNLGPTNNIRWWADDDDPTFASVTWEHAAQPAGDYSLEPEVSDLRPWDRFHGVVLSGDPSPSVRYAKVRFLADATHPDGYWRASWIFVGRALSLPLREWQPADRLVGPAGAETVLHGHQVLVSGVTDAEYRNLLAVRRSLGSSGRCVWIPDPVATQRYSTEAGLYRITELAGRRLVRPSDSQAAAGAYLWEVEIRLEEVPV